MDIENIPTYALCDELKRREGVETIIVDPYDTASILPVEGPAIVFVVTD